MLSLAKLPDEKLQVSDLLLRKSMKGADERVNFTALNNDAPAEALIVPNLAGKRLSLLLSRQRAELVLSGCRAVSKAKQPSKPRPNVVKQLKSCLITAKNQ